MVHWSGFGPPLLKLPFPTRMTILRVGHGLFVHSPTMLTAELKAEVDAIGIPGWIIGPNRLHYWWIPQWCHAYPRAVVYLAPRIMNQAAGRLDPFVSRCLPLDRQSGYARISRAQAYPSRQYAPPRSCVA
jgi:hypothetical protein